MCVCVCVCVRACKDKQTLSTIYGSLLSTRYKDIQAVVNAITVQAGHTLKTKPCRATHPFFSL